MQQPRLSRASVPLLLRVFMKIFIIAPEYLAKGGSKKNWRKYELEARVFARKTTLSNYESFFPFFLKFSLPRKLESFSFFIISFFPSYFLLCKFLRSVFNQMLLNIN